MNNKSIQDRGNELINDWRPEVKSLLNRLVAAGCTLLSGDNGEDGFFFSAEAKAAAIERIEKRQAEGTEDLSRPLADLKGREVCADVDAFIAQLTACDEAHLTVATPTDTPNKRRTLYLVLGNSPGELVCDYSCDDTLDKVTEEHYNAWEGKAQPKWTKREAYPHVYGPKVEVVK